MISLRSICRTGSERPRMANSRCRPMRCRPLCLWYRWNRHGRTRPRIERRSATIEIVIGAIWHLPLYRQAKMLASQGIELDRSTLAFWVGYAAAELMPLYERLKANLLASAKLAVDETPVPVLDPGRGQTKTGYFWAIARDDRPWGGTGPPAVVYSYAPGRGGEHLEKLLANYRGIVQCDGYAPYKKLPAERITVALCWSHLRREFFKIAE